MTPEQKNRQLPAPRPEATPPEVQQVRFNYQRDAHLLGYEVAHTRYLLLKSLAELETQGILPSVMQIYLKHTFQSMNLLDMLPPEITGISIQVNGGKIDVTRKGAKTERSIIITVQEAIRLHNILDEIRQRYPR
jgi:hypothetical protein